MKKSQTKEEKDFLQQNCRRKLQQAAQGQLFQKWCRQCQSWRKKKKQVFKELKQEKDFLEQNGRRKLLLATTALEKDLLDKMGGKNFCWQQKA